MSCPWQPTCSLSSVPGVGHMGELTGLPDRSRSAITTDVLKPAYSEHPKDAGVRGAPEVHALAGLLHWIFGTLQGGVAQVLLVALQ